MKTVKLELDKKRLTVEVVCEKDAIWGDPATGGCVHAHARQKRLGGIWIASRRPAALTAARQPAAGCLAPLGACQLEIIIEAVAAG